VTSQKKIETVVRKLEQNEAAILRELFYHAIFMPEDADPLPFSIVDHPDLVKYHQKWGREGDLAVVADSEGKIVGAAWCRLWKGEEKGYGYIADNIPELSMAVIPEYRSMGIGTKLLTELFHAIKEAGFKALSISVEKRNRAANLYMRLGFKVVKDKSPDYLMQIDF
jgi:[ribosomal protein S18]-alanine N-acetyltransferase